MWREGSSGFTRQYEAMPLAPPRCCPCGGRIQNGKCDRCGPKKENRPNYRAFYNKRVWRDRIKPQQLAESPLCVHCQAKGIVVAATVVDHIIPFKDSWELFIDRNNHQSLCKDCHDVKTGTERWT